MRRYRTQILIPSDRMVVLQLPQAVPEGWATITVQVQESEPGEHHESDPDHTDIEWWDEFDDEDEDTHS